MISNSRTARYSALFVSAAQNPLAVLRSQKSIRNFALESNVGSNAKKILIRFADLAHIFSIITKPIPVVEFGSGSSTLFFLAHPKVESLVTYEEKTEYLPKASWPLRKKWIIESNKFTKEKTDHVMVTRFDDFENYLKNSSVIYIDGPSTPISPVSQKTIPNTEILKAPNLENHIILVDGRQETVFLILQKVLHSHYFFPSDAYKLIYNYEGHTSCAITSSAHKHLCRNVRTSAFFPKSYKFN